MLVLTLGDPYSINVEMAALLLESLATQASHATTRARFPRFPVVLIGSHWHWLNQLERLTASVRPGVKALLAGLIKPDKIENWQPVLSRAGNQPSEIFFIDVGQGMKPALAESLTVLERGTIACRTLEMLRLLPLSAGASAERLAVITGPIDKHACQAAGYKFPGQTEFFEDLWQTPAVMTLAGPQLRVGLVTNHLALRDISSKITSDLLTRKLQSFVSTLQRSFGIAKPRIAVCGLNPHASDRGLFGDEEERIITPTLERLAASLDKSAVISGPLPADTIFYRAYHGQYDGVLAMYHDQGLGPLKTVHFDTAVNISGGLPHLRLSPDHGPAADLFLTGKASAKSWLTCLDISTAYLQRRG